MLDHPYCAGDLSGSEINLWYAHGFIYFEPVHARAWISRGTACKIPTASPIGSVEAAHRLGVLDVDVKLKSGIDPWVDREPDRFPARAPPGRAILISSCNIDHNQTNFNFYKLSHSHAQTKSCFSVA
jgi:hypothetical protein